MGRYRETHSRQEPWPGENLIGNLFGLSDEEQTVKITEIEDTGTGEKATGYGWTREEANRNAWNNLHEKDC